MEIRVAGGEPTPSPLCAAASIAPRGGSPPACACVRAQEGLQSNSPFAPFVSSLQWPDEEECVVSVERAEAVEGGAALIARFIEPAARNASELCVTAGE